MISKKPNKERIVVWPFLHFIFFYLLNYEKNFYAIIYRVSTDLSLTNYKFARCSSKFFRNPLFTATHIRA
ncbi:hypothetical protein BC30052_2141 [Bacillus cereus]|nr:hypothetical protein BC30052_2141 [Bacillus cereus]